MRLAAISGSLRAVSTNTALLRALSANAPVGIQVEIVEGIGALPIFNPDVQETAVPAGVALFEDRIREAAGIIISCPEYAHGVPGGLKNALDWLVGGDVAVGKPVMLVHASPRSQLSRAALREILKAMSFTPFDRPELEVTLIGKRPDEVDQLLSNPDLRNRMRAIVREFASFAELARTG